MNKPKAHDNLIPVRDYAKTRLNRFGKHVSTESVYKFIRQHKLNPEKKIPFEYIDKGEKGIWIVVDPNSLDVKTIKNMD